MKVELLSCARLLATPWTGAYQAPRPWDFPGKSTGVGCHCLLHPPSIFPSLRVFSNESTLCIKWPKYWSFSFSISSSNESSVLISFRIDWLDLLAVQGTFKSLLQHHSSKASILQPSAFFTTQLSYLYVTAGKIIALGTGYSLLCYKSLQSSVAGSNENRSFCLSVCGQEFRSNWTILLGWEDPLEEGLATHSSILAWRIPWTEEPGGLRSKGSQRVRHDLATEHVCTHQGP